jgi:hypothetical protein
MVLPEHSLHPVGFCVCDIMGVVEVVGSTDVIAELVEAWVVEIEGLDGTAKGVGKETDGVARGRDGMAKESDRAAKEMVGTDTETGGTVK